MKSLPSILWALAAMLIAMPGSAQVMPDIGFDSVGRGWPLAASVHDQPLVGPSWNRQLDQPVEEEELRLIGFPPDELPSGIEPLPIDIFTSADFYADQALWSDPRYFRCNSPNATEFQRGIVLPTPLADSTAESPWGRCDLDYPRAAIVSPYGFATAEEHYKALLEETRRPFLHLEREVIHIVRVVQMVLQFREERFGD